MKPPILEKEVKSSFYGMEVVLKGKVYDYPFKHTSEHNLYSEIRIYYDNGDLLHPGFPYIVSLSEDELDFELNFHANNIKTKPNLYGQQPTILN